jgi:hypothetical protein
MTIIAVTTAEAQVTTTVYFDDFESAAPAGTFMPDSPNVGPNWTRAFTNSAHGSVINNPESETRNTSSLTYISSRPANRGNFAVHTMVAPLDKWASSLIDANNNARLEFKYYGIATGLGTNPGLSLIVNEHATPGSTPTGFALTGFAFNNGMVGPGATAQPITYSDWHDFVLDFNFGTQQYTYSMDGGATSTPINFTNAGRVTITNLWFGHLGDGSEFYIDDVKLTTDGPAAGLLKTWTANASGTWTDPNNWQVGSIPNDATHQVLFGSAITAARTVAVDTNKTVNTMSFANANTYAISGPATITFAGTSPTIEASSGSHQLQTKVKLDANTAVNGNGGVINFQNQLDLNGKVLTVSGAVNINHSTTNSTGTGSIVSSGILGTAGATPFSGNLTSTGTLDIDISGTGLGQTDVFNITGSASLQGSVDVDVLGAFVPSGPITILTATGGINLTSGPLTLTGEDAGLFSGVSVMGNSLVLNIGAAGVSGDYNDDGVVDAADYVMWRKLDGTSTEMSNDPNPLPIDSDQYNTWTSNFGEPGGGSGGDSANAAVPEPTTLAIVLCGALLVMMRRSGCQG